MDTAQKHTRTRSLIHSLRQPASHSVRQTKKSNILQEDSILPGGWDIIPLHRVGGARGGRSTRVRGFVSTAEYPSIHTRLHFSVSLLALKAIITHKSISAAGKCILMVFLMWVRVFLYVDYKVDTDGASCTSLLRSKLRGDRRSV